MNAATSHTGVLELKKLYHLLREKEGRIYSDEEVLKLPAVQRGHTYYHEWQMRKRSAKRLVQYLRQRKDFFTVLEIGTGNGWLAHQLAKLPGCKVTGTDIHTAELQQATRVFSHVPNLQFIYGDMGSETLTDLQYDIVVLAACIQYFPSLPEIIRHSLKRLKREGELHILDSPLYQDDEVLAAKQRSKAYYLQMGLPEMAEHYFHHRLVDLDGFNYTMLYRPSALQHYLLQHKNPFPWVRIKNVG